MRNDGVPLYHFVVVVDDEEMEITDVIRGEDHLSNTPKHIALIRALGYREPRFGHIPLILNADRSKMSKRKSQTAMTAYREEGYLPEAMVNFLAFLGWSPGTEEEIFTLDELAARFEIGKVHKGGAVFDEERLDHLNGVYIRALTDEQLALRLRPWVPEAVADERPAAHRAAHQGAPGAAGRRRRTGRLRRGSPTRSWPAGTPPEQLRPKKGDCRRGSPRRWARARHARRARSDADFSADVLEQRCREAAEAAGMKAGDFFTPIRRGHHRPDGLPAPVRIARAARPGAVAGAHRRGDRQAGGGRGVSMDEPRVGDLRAAARTTCSMRTCSSRSAPRPGVVAGPAA